MVRRRDLAADAEAPNSWTKRCSHCPTTPTSRSCPRARTTPPSAVISASGRHVRRNRPRLSHHVLVDLWATRNSQERGCSRSEERSGAMASSLEPCDPAAKRPDRKHSRHDRSDRKKRVSKRRMLSSIILWDVFLRSRCTIPGDGKKLMVESCTHAQRH